MCLLWSLWPWWFSLFQLCVISALFSCVISYTARKSGMKQRYGAHPKMTFSTLTTTTSVTSSKPVTSKGPKASRLNDAGIDVKDWISLVLNPEKPPIQKVTCSATEFGKILHTLANYWHFISYLAKCWAYFGILLAQFSLLLMTN